VEIFIRKDAVVSYAKRRFQKLLELLGFLGGLLKLYLSFWTFIVTYYNRKKCNKKFLKLNFYKDMVEVANSLYKFEDPNKIMAEDK
jgi:hypothetical protein